MFVLPKHSKLWTTITAINITYKQYMILAEEAIMGVRLYLSACVSNISHHQEPKWRTAPESCLTERTREASGLEQSCDPTRHSCPPLGLNTGLFSQFSSSRDFKIARVLFLKLYIYLYTYVLDHFWKSLQVKKSWGLFLYLCDPI